MKTNKNTVSTTITGIITEDNRLVISVPLISNPKLTKNGKNYTVANTGDWPNNWVTVEIAGEEVGLTLCALVKNPEHPDNKPAPVAPPVPAAPKFFTTPAGNLAPINQQNGNSKINGSKRIMPGSVK